MPKRSRSRFVEPLEDRRLLSVTTAYVAPAADFTDPTNPGNPHPGDTVTWNGGGQFTTPVPGLTFGTDAFTSIAAAVANVSSGGTVDVAPGTYDEHSISLNQPITLNGSNFGVDPNTATRGGEAIIDAQSLGGALTVNADNVTVDGFTIQGGQTITDSGIDMANTTSGVQVLNNIITDNQIGIYADSNGPSKIQNNLITANNLSGPAGGAGIYSDASNGLTIDSNVFTDQTTNSAMIFTASAANVHQNLTVTNNVVNNNAPGNSAIYVVAVDGGEFANNDITTQNTGSALHFAGDDTNISVHNNNFDTVTNGVAVTDDGFGLGNNSNITVNYNSFTNASTAALSIGAGGYTGTLDASKNWWGDISGPTIASNVGGAGQTIVDPNNQVIYKPWLIYGTDADATAAGFQLPTTVPVTSQGDVSAALNDFTLLQNAIGAAAAGQTIDLSGAFDWTKTNSLAAYEASTNTAPTGDIRGVALPDGVNNLTITNSASNATITGVGDSTDGNYNTFLFSAVDGSSPSDVGNNNLTVSKLNISNFMSGVMLGWNNGGMFNGTLVKNNTITVAADNNNSLSDVQGIAVYFWNGQNQMMTGNTIDFMGNGTRTVGTGARSYGFQDGTTGGTGYNGLSIDHNIFQLLPSAIGGSEVVTGIWENGHNDDNASHISVADNQFLGIQGQRLFDIGLQLSSQTSNMAIDGNTFTDVKYVYWVGAHNGDANGDQFTFTNNVLTRVGDATGVFLQNVDAVTPATITINWNTNNTIDGFKGIRGLNELSVQATGETRTAGGATDLNAVNGVGSMPLDFVNTNWGAPARFTNPLTTPDGTPGPIAYEFNTFTTVQAGVNAVDAGGTTNVLPGTYAENVTIAKNLTLSGMTLTGGTASPPTAIIQPAAGDGITISTPATNVTVNDLEVTGAANGINASGVAKVSLNNLLLDANAVGLAASSLTTLNLTDLTLTANTTAGGTISNVVTVNDTPITGSTGATDTITGSSIQRGSDDVLDYSGVTNLNVTGSDGSDTFDVTPAVATTISIDGGLPTPPAKPGDTLNVNPAGTTNPSISFTATPTGYQGSWTFTGDMPVNFTGIETLGNIADLSITKTDNSTTPGSAVPGTPLSYTIVVSNNGPNDVTGATVVDNFPAGFTVTSSTSSFAGGASIAASAGIGGNINDTVDLPPGSTITYVVSGTIASAATGTLSNTASVTAPANVLDITPANNTATDTDTLTPEADLKITKTDNSPTPGHVMSGSSLKYTVVVTNAGPSDVTGAKVIDTFPAAFTVGTVTATATGGASGFTAGSGNINDSVDMPVGSTITYVVMGTVSANAGGTLSNTATVTAPAGVIDTNPANNSATDSNVISTTTDLSISKTDNSPSPGSVVPGTTLKYTIVVTNSGANTATGATVSDTFPADFTAATYTATATGGATGFTASGSGNISDTVNLPAGSSITYVVTGTVASSATGTLSNTATVTPPANIVDTNPANNSATDTDTLTAQADLSITKTDGSTTAVPGTSDIYTIVVANAGPSDVVGATVADTLPAALVGASFTATATGGATGFTAHGSGNLSDTVNLPAGSSITYVLTGTIKASATGTLSNTATVTAPAGVTDTNLANNSATDTDTLTAQADLKITKTDNSATPGSVVAGHSLVYTIVVTNAGPSDVTGAIVSDTLPAELSGATFTATASGGATGFSAHGSGNLSDTVNLPAGSSITYIVSGTVSPAATGSLSNTATVTAPAGVTDANTANNTATDTATISAQSGVSVTKSDSAGGNSATSTTGSIVAGRSMAYIVVISNSGPSDVTGASIADTFPAGFTDIQVADSEIGGAKITSSPPTAANVLEHNIDLPAGSSITFVVTGTVSASATGNLSNTANVTLPAGVTNTGNLSATDTDTIITQGGVTVVKSDDKGGTSGSLQSAGHIGSVSAGGELTYTIVVSNSGPSDLTGATISDAFPSGFTAASFTATATGGASGFTASGSGNISDTVNMPAGSSVTYVVMGTVSSSATGSLSNTASVKLPAGATNNGNLSATDTDTIASPPPQPFGYLAGVPGDGTAQTFVHNLYRELMGREPDASGQSYWVSQVQQNSTAAGRQAVIASFMNSQEYKEHYVTTLYEVFLGRATDAAGLQFWAAAMGNPGTAGGHSSSADEKFILSAIVGSEEFYSNAGGTNQAFAEALYKDLLGRTGDTAGITFWSDLANTLPRDAVVRLFLSTPEAAHLLLDSFYPAAGGTAANPLPVPGSTVAAGSDDLAIVTGDGWENLYLQGPFDSSPEANDAFFAELASGASWDDVQLGMLTTDQFFTNPNRPVTK